MEEGLLRDALTVLAGVVTGIMSGAFGVGGAVVSTPAIRLLGAPALIAVGSTLPSIFPSAVTGTLRYSREGLVDWRVVAWTVPVGVVMAVAGSFLSQEVPGEGHVLMILTAALLAVTAFRMSRSKAATIEATERRDTRPVLAAIGATAGLLSGLLGVGGGVVMVPGFSEIARLPLKVSIATSLVCVGLLALPSTIAHAYLGDIDWRLALLLTAGVVPGARLGAAIAIRASDRRLRIAVAAFLAIIAVVYAVSETAALL